MPRDIIIIIKCFIFEYNSSSNDPLEFIDFITDKFIISECQDSIYELLSIVKESIRDIGSVLLVMTPWDDPIPLWRVWCLFEKYSAIDVQADMHIAFPFFQREAFKAAIGGISTPLWMF